VRNTRQCRQASGGAARGHQIEERGAQELERGQAPECLQACSMECSELQDLPVVLFKKAKTAKNAEKLQSKLQLTAHSQSVKGQSDLITV
jgi:hypothetical protein